MFELIDKTESALFSYQMNEFKNCFLSLLDEIIKESQNGSSELNFDNTVLNEILEAYENKDFLYALEMIKYKIANKDGKQFE